MKNNVSLSHDEVIDLIETTISKLPEQLHDVDVSATVYEGENWTAKEVMAHINGWMREAQTCLEAHGRGEQHCATFTNGDQFNREHVSVRMAWSFEDVVEEWLQIHRDIRLALRALSKEQYLKAMMVPWGAVGKVDDFVVHMVEHEREHINDIVSHAKAQRR